MYPTNRYWLANETARHERSLDGGRAWQDRDGDAGREGRGNQPGAGIVDPRQAGVGDESDALTGDESRHQIGAASCLVVAVVREQAGR